MMLLLKNWKIILTLSISGILTIFFLYSYHLYNKVDALTAENKALSGQITYTNDYISKYESAKAENDAMSAELTKEMANVKNDPKCPAPASIKRIISQLR